MSRAGAELQSAGSQPGAPTGRRWFRRGPWENAATALIGLGVIMLVQPFSQWLYGHGFLVLLVGTLGFVVVSHFPEA